MEEGEEEVGKGKGVEGKKSDEEEEEIGNQGQGEEVEKLRLELGFSNFKRALLIIGSFKDGNGGNDIKKEKRYQGFKQGKEKLKEN